MTSQDQERMVSSQKMMYSHLCLKVNKQVHHHQYSIHQLNNKHHRNPFNKPSKVSITTILKDNNLFSELPTRNIVSSGGSRREPLGPIAKAMTKSMNEANKIPHFGYKGKS